MLIGRLSVKVMLWQNKEVQYVIVYKSIAGDLRRTMDGKASCSVKPT